jgi:hypothetical protein
MRKTLLALLNLFVCVAISGQAPVVLQTTSAKDIIPEGIAIHEASQRIFVSSINRHNIIIVSQMEAHPTSSARGRTALWKAWA